MDRELHDVHARLPHGEPSGATSCKAPCLLCAPSGTALTPGPGSVLAAIWMGAHFAESLLAGALDPPVLEELGLLGTGRTPVCAPLERSQVPAVEGLIAGIEEELERRALAYESCLRLKLAELLLVCCRSRPGAPQQEIGPPMAGAHPSVGRVVRHLEQHYADALSLEGLAHQCSLSPGYLSRAFHAGTGMPLFEYINRLRVRKACVLLKGTSMPILEVAYAVGYNNVSFFNRYFRRIVRMSPRDYRLSSSR